MQSRGENILAHAATNSLIHRGPTRNDFYSSPLPMQDRQKHTGCTGAAISCSIIEAFGSRLRAKIFSLCEKKNLLGQCLSESQKGLIFLSDFFLKKAHHKEGNRSRVTIALLFSAGESIGSPGHWWQKCHPFSNINKSWGTFQSPGGIRLWDALALHPSAGNAWEL